MRPLCRRIRAAVHMPRNPAFVAFRKRAANDFFAIMPCPCEYLIPPLHPLCPVKPHPLVASVQVGRALGVDCSRLGSLRVGTLVTGDTCHLAHVEHITFLSFMVWRFFGISPAANSLANALSDAGHVSRCSERSVCPVKSSQQQTSSYLAG
jgi:hypothetical protein